MVTRKRVTAKLRKVIDPELGVNIVDLGLVYKIVIHGGKVSVLMTLTTPGCPLGGVFEELVSGAIRKIPGVNEVAIELTFDPPWTQELMSEAAKAQLGFD
ncbi:MAG: hypothetical protein A2900_00295 [Candidatus Chisholmbacteria bacterium RIFCSPLOWO2_01_FULL_50_28]|uniref:MIP18 family-like domain-containing protein n=1 Tax=Candidatus Chisholmbacteria bacterium RIFCSPHIGHO2_01_FULL_52_32 TaxID=1797591 RepID=A0A1G1VRG1_9BACT|nr:MAG: hypothetical protein A2786_00640 [Candidatus Chisholmbacteria bacterium RIFCSPHIGHO2_01_FULL_52_32]OGY19544.1 MAG: hypothetical protein A2900_00295 [Candidatus Chisholmbacteria bacterium RIFCSPLOWO2_01_FULL_50_28]